MRRDVEHRLRMAFHVELRGLCQHIIAEQSAEIAQLRTWLREWYDICEGRRRRPRTAS